MELVGGQGTCPKTRFSEDCVQGEFRQPHFYAPVTYGKMKGCDQQLIYCIQVHTGLVFSLVYRLSVVNALKGLEHYPQQYMQQLLVHSLRRLQLSSHHELVLLLML
jgi:hypothetical protein